MPIRYWIKYILSPYTRSKCKISFLYSILVDLDRYGNKIALGRSYKEHRKKFMEKEIHN